MPLFRRDTALIYYEETGAGPPLILLHGFSGNTHYWRETGLLPRLAARCRVIALDLRGHGQTTVTGAPAGFDVDTLGDDVQALAAHLGLERYYLLGHSTGGMVAARYALRRSDALLGLMLMGAGSATLFGAGDPRKRRQALHLFAELYANHTWDRIFAHLRLTPGPLLFHLDQSPERERLWARLETICRGNDPNALAAFVRAFYTDPDPQAAGLARLPCPTLVLVGRHDKLFLASSEWLARTIPNARLVVLAGAGHMLGLEAPDATAAALLAFLDDAPVQ